MRKLWVRAPSGSQYVNMQVVKADDLQNHYESFVGSTPTWRAF